MTLNEKAIIETREEFNQYYRECKNYIATSKKYGCTGAIGYMIRIELNHFYGYITALADLKLIAYEDYKMFEYSARTLYQETKEECEKYICC